MGRQTIRKNKKTAQQHGAEPTPSRQTDPKFDHVSGASAALCAKPVSLNFPPAPGPLENEMSVFGKRTCRIPSHPALIPLLLVALTIDLALKLRQHRHDRR